VEHLSSALLQIRTAGLGLIGRAQQLTREELLALLACVCIGLLLLFTAWLATLKRARFLKSQLRAARSELNELRESYNNEVRWRKATEAHDAAHRAKPARLVPSQPSAGGSSQTEARTTAS
jgi:hypothetical protein